MSDVRQQLRVVIQDTAERRHAEHEAASSDDFANAILERFYVTPKPVVTASHLGQMMSVAWHSTSESVGSDTLGRKMLDQLEHAGLKIVRVDDDRG